MNLHNILDYVVSHIKTWLKLKLVLVLVSLILLVFAVGIFHPSVLFFKPDSELTYTEQINSMTCLNKHNVCLVLYELVLGNTGKDDIAKVNITINHLPESMSSSKTRVTPLTALTHKEYGVDIEEVDLGGKIEIEMKNFKSGTVAEFVYTDMMFPIDETSLLLESKDFVEIVTNAHIVNSDPRLTVVGRMIESNL